MESTQDVFHSDINQSSVFEDIKSSKFFNEAAEKTKETLSSIAKKTEKHQGSFFQDSKSAQVFNEATEKSKDILNKFVNSAIESVSSGVQNYGTDTKHKSTSLRKTISSSVDAPDYYYPHINTDPYFNDGLPPMPFYPYPPPIPWENITRSTTVLQPQTNVPPVILLPLPPSELNAFNSDLVNNPNVDRTSPPKAKTREKGKERRKHSKRKKKKRKLSRKNDVTEDDREPYTWSHPAVRNAKWWNVWDYIDVPRQRMHKETLRNKKKKSNLVDIQPVQADVYPNVGSFNHILAEKQFSQNIVHMHSNRKSKSPPLPSYVPQKPLKHHRAKIHKTPTLPQQTYFNEGSQNKPIIERPIYCNYDLGSDVEEHYSTRSKATWVNDETTNLARECRYSGPPEDVAPPVDEKKEVFCTDEDIAEVNTTLVHNVQIKIKSRKNNCFKIRRFNMDVQSAKLLNSIFSVGNNTGQLDTKSNSPGTKDSSTQSWRPPNISCKTGVQKHGKFTHSNDYCSAVSCDLQSQQGRHLKRLMSHFYHDLINLPDKKEQYSNVEQSSYVENSGVNSNKSNTVLSSPFNDASEISSLNQSSELSKTMTEIVPKEIDPLEDGKATTMMEEKYHKSKDKNPAFRGSYKINVHCDNLCCPDTQSCHKGKLQLRKKTRIKEKLHEPKIYFAISSDNVVESCHTAREKLKQESKSYKQEKKKKDADPTEARRQTSLCVNNSPVSSAGQLCQKLFVSSQAGCVVKLTQNISPSQLLTSISHPVETTRYKLQPSCQCCHQNGSNKVLLEADCAKCPSHHSNTEGINLLYSRDRSIFFKPGDGTNSGPRCRSCYPQSSFGCFDITRFKSATNPRTLPLLSSDVMRFAGDDDITPMSPGKVKSKQIKGFNNEIINCPNQMDNTCLGCTFSCDQISSKQTKACTIFHDSATGLDPCSYCCACQNCVQPKEDACIQRQNSCVCDLCFKNIYDCHSPKSNPDCSETVKCPKHKHNCHENNKYPKCKHDFCKSTESAKNYSDKHSEGFQSVMEKDMSCKLNNNICQRSGCISTSKLEKCTDPPQNNRLKSKCSQCHKIVRKCEKHRCKPSDSSSCVCVKKTCSQCHRNTISNPDDIKSQCVVDKRNEKTHCQSTKRIVNDNQKDKIKDSFPRNFNTVSQSNPNCKLHTNGCQYNKCCYFTGQKSKVRRQNDFLMISDKICEMDQNVCKYSEDINKVCRNDEKKCSNCVCESLARHEYTQRLCEKSKNVECGKNASEKKGNVDNVHNSNKDFKYSDDCILSSQNTDKCCKCHTKQTRYRAESYTQAPCHIHSDQLLDTGYRSRLKEKNTGKDVYCGTSQTDTLSTKPKIKSKTKKPTNYCPPCANKAAQYIFYNSSKTKNDCEDRNNESETEEDRSTSSQFSTRLMLENKQESPAMEQQEYYENIYCNRKHYNKKQPEDRAYLNTDISIHSHKKVTDSNEIPFSARETRPTVKDIRSASKKDKISEGEREKCIESNDNDPWDKDDVKSNVEDDVKCNVGADVRSSVRGNVKSNKQKENANEKQNKEGNTLNKDQPNSERENHNLKNAKDGCGYKMNASTIEDNRAVTEPTPGSSSDESLELAPTASSEIPDTNKLSLCSRYRSKTLPPDQQLKALAISSESNVSIPSPSNSSSSPNTSSSVSHQSTLKENEPTKSDHACSHRYDSDIKKSSAVQSVSQFSCKSNNSSEVSAGCKFIVDSVIRTTKGNDSSYKRKTHRRAPIVAKTLTYRKQAQFNILNKKEHSQPTLKKQRKNNMPKCRQSTAHYDKYNTKQRKPGEEKKHNAQNCKTPQITFHHSKDEPDYKMIWTACYGIREIPSSEVESSERRENLYWDQGEVRSNGSKMKRPSEDLYWSHSCCGVKTRGFEHGSSSQGQVNIEPNITQPSSSNNDNSTSVQCRSYHSLLKFWQQFCEEQGQNNASWMSCGIKEKTRAYSEYEQKGNLSKKSEHMLYPGKRKHDQSKKSKSIEHSRLSKKSMKTQVQIKTSITKENITNTQAFHKSPHFSSHEKYIVSNVESSQNCLEFLSKPQSRLPSQQHPQSQFHHLLQPPWQLQSQLQSQSQSQSEPQSQSQPKSQPHLKPQLQPQSQPQSQVQSQSQSQPQSQPHLQPLLQPQSQSHPHLHPPSNLQLKPHNQRKPQATTEAFSKSLNKDRCNNEQVRKEQQCQELHKVHSSYILSSKKCLEETISFKMPNDGKHDEKSRERVPQSDECQVDNKYDVTSLNDQQSSSVVSQSSHNSVAAGQENVVHTSTCHKPSDLLPEQLASSCHTVREDSSTRQSLLCNSSSDTKSVGNKKHKEIIIVKPQNFKSSENTSEEVQLYNDIISTFISDEDESLYYKCCATKCEEHGHLYDKYNETKFEDNESLYYESTKFKSQNNPIPCFCHVMEAKNVNSTERCLANFENNIESLQSIVDVQLKSKNSSISSNSKEMKEIDTHYGLSSCLMCCIINKDHCRPTEAAEQRISNQETSQPSALEVLPSLHNMNTWAVSDEDFKTQPLLLNSSISRQPPVQIPLSKLFLCDSSTQENVKSNPQQQKANCQLIDKSSSQISSSLSSLRCFTLSNSYGTETSSSSKLDQKSDSKDNTKLEFKYNSQSSKTRADASSGKIRRNHNLLKNETVPSIRLNHDKRTVAPNDSFNGVNSKLHISISKRDMKSCVKPEYTAVLNTIKVHEVIHSMSHSSIATERMELSSDSQLPGSNSSQTKTVSTVGGQNYLEEKFDYENTLPSPVWHQCQQELLTQNDNNWTLSGSNSDDIEVISLDDEWNQRQCSPSCKSEECQSQNCSNPPTSPQQHPMFLSNRRPAGYAGCGVEMADIRSQQSSCTSSVRSQRMLAQPLVIKQMDHCTGSLRRPDTLSCHIAERLKLNATYVKPLAVHANNYQSNDLTHCIRTLMNRKHNNTCLRESQRSKGVTYHAVSHTYTPIDTSYRNITSFSNCALNRPYIYASLPKTLSSSIQGMFSLNKPTAVHQFPTKSHDHGHMANSSLDLSFLSSQDRSKILSPMRSSYCTAQYSLREVKDYDKIKKYLEWCTEEEFWRYLYHMKRGTLCTDLNCQLPSHSQNEHSTTDNTTQTINDSDHVVNNVSCSFHNISSSENVVKFKAGSSNKSPESEDKIRNKGQTMSKLSFKKETKNRHDRESSITEHISKSTPTSQKQLGQGICQGCKCRSPAPYPAHISIYINTEPKHDPIIEYHGENPSKLDRNLYRKEIKKKTKKLSSRRRNCASGSSASTFQSENCHPRNADKMFRGKNKMFRGEKEKNVSCRSSERKSTNHTNLKSGQCKKYKQNKHLQHFEQTSTDTMKDFENEHPSERNKCSKLQRKHLDSCSPLDNAIQVKREAYRLQLNKRCSNSKQYKKDDLHPEHSQKYVHETNDICELKMLARSITNLCLLNIQNVANISKGISNNERGTSPIKLLKGKRSLISFEFNRIPVFNDSIVPCVDANLKHRSSSHNDSHSVAQCKKTQFNLPLTSIVCNQNITCKVQRLSKDQARLSGIRYNDHGVLSTADVCNTTDLSDHQTLVKPKFVFVLESPPPALLHGTPSSSAVTSPDISDI